MNLRNAWFSVVVFLAAIPFTSAQQSRWWDNDVEAALAKSGDNRAELEKTLTAAPKSQRTGVAFLIANMPDRDLKSIKSDLLISNLDLAYKARAEFAWAQQVPEELFLNDVLPYASVSETREAWRAEMLEVCRPIVAGCKTMSEAAQALNEKLFPAIKVRYSTNRNRADQSPGESKKIGMASCTGLSILLVDACRSVGIPARVVGIPKWVNKNGNHTWVEIWDGDWHFTGACEFNRAGLDKTWFANDAALAKKDTIENSIYASTYKRSATKFPLPWLRGSSDINAENVTDRYTRKSGSDAITRLLVRVWGPGKKERIVVPVKIVDVADAQFIRSGQSKGESADTNDTLVFEVPRKKKFVVEVDAVKHDVATEDRESVLVDIELKDAPKKTSSLTTQQRTDIEAAAKAFFDSGAKLDSKFDEFLKSEESAVRQIVWKAYAASSKHADLKNDFEAKQVRHDNLTSPYTIKYVGKKPKAGWPLFVAMHGGGGAPKRVNDSQWAVMQKYYKDQDSVEGYAYIALRAPNDVWNGFYDLYILPLITNLIRQQTVFGDVDPNKVFVMGYSHGGYGAFYIGPKIPDRFAAIHASAAAQTGGTISPKSLRNTRFTFMVGENDTAYGRRKLCEAFAAEIEKLRKDNPGDYPVEFEFKPGFGHGGLPDRDKIKEMYGYTRKPFPKHLTWELTDSQVKDHFWITVAEPKPGQRIDAVVKGNAIEVKSEKIDRFSLEFDGRLVDIRQPIDVTINGKTSKQNATPSLATLCESLARRGDIELAASCRLELKASE